MATPDTSMAAVEKAIRIEIKALSERLASEAVHRRLQDSEAVRQRLAEALMWCGSGHGDGEHDHSCLACSAVYDNDALGYSDDMPEYDPLRIKVTSGDAAERESVEDEARWLFHEALAVDPKDLMSWQDCMEFVLEGLNAARAAVRKDRENR